MQVYIAKMMMFAIDRIVMYLYDYLTLCLTDPISKSRYDNSIHWLDCFILILETNQLHVRLFHFNLGDHSTPC